MDFMLNANSFSFSFVVAMAVSGGIGAALLHLRQSPSLTTTMAGAVIGSVTLALFLAIPGLAPLVALSVLSGFVVARVRLSRVSTHPSISPYRR